MLTAERLRHLLDYDPDTGIFTRRHCPDVAARVNSRWAGKPAGGSVRPSGYLAICVDGTRYQAHRLAWLYMHGRWPDKFLDHKNLCKTDNRFSNLREATPLQNSANISRRKISKSGYRGVSFRKNRNHWVAHISINHRRTYLGAFATPEEAAAVYGKAAANLYGDFCPDYLIE